MELFCVDESITCSMHGQIVGEAKVECLVTILGYNWQLAALRQNLKYADIDLCVNWGQSYVLYKKFNKIWRMKAAIQLLLNFMYITLESRFAKLSWKDGKCLEESMETIMMYSPPSPLLSLLEVTESDDRETLNMASGESPHPRAVHHHPITSAHSSAYSRREGKLCKIVSPK